MLQDYPVDGKDPIEWVVLDKTEDSIFVMSKYALDCLPYNKVYAYVTWQFCTLREWLNEKFYNRAKGLIEGRAEGETKVLAELVQDGIIDTKTAAKKLGVSVKKFKELAAAQSFVL